MVSDDPGQERGQEQARTASKPPGLAASSPATQLPIRRCTNTPLHALWLQREDRYDETGCRVRGTLGTIGAFSLAIPSFSASVACLLPVASTPISCEVDPIVGMLLKAFHRYVGDGLMVHDGDYFWYPERH